MNRCPTAHDLEQWLDEELSDARQQDVAEHVGDCARCQAALEQLTEKTCAPPGRTPAPDRLPFASDASAAFLSRLKLSPPSSASGEAARPGPNRTAPPPEVPVVAGYEILGELGRGGMGVVYKARHLALNRLVALKMILAGAHAGPKDLERFRQEAEAVARLHHPNIVQIFDIGTSEGRPYFALEYVEQGSLAQRLRGDPQPLQPAVRLIETLARAIHFAHQHRVVHRDLKPANILLQEEGIAAEYAEGTEKEPEEEQSGDGRGGGDKEESPDSSFRVLRGFRGGPLIPKITDFGLAKRLDEQHKRSHSGEVLGTPSYMAPEQAGPKAREVGPAADVYALGAILYEMLTGHPPFKGATGLDTVLLVLHEEPVRPSRLRPKLPRDLETICLKCLQKEPARRYASALALADDLRRFRRGAPIRARPVGVLERGWKWTRRRPLSAALLGGIVLVTLLGFVGVSWQWRVAVWERNEKEVQRQQARNALYYSRIAQSQLQWRVNDLPGALGSLADCVRQGDQHDRRGWEWYYLHTLYHPDLFTFMHQRSGLDGAVAYRPDGSAIASIISHPENDEGDRSEFRMWDAAGGGVIHERSLPVPFQRLAFRPDGKRLVLGGTDGTVAIWDAATCREILRHPIHNTRIAGLAFSPDGSLVASAAVGPAAPWQPWQGRVELWDAETGAVVRTLTGPRGLGFLSVAFHPTLPWLATGGEDTFVRIWDTSNGKQLGELSGHKYPVCGVAFSPDGKILVSAATNGNLKIWDLNLERKPKGPKGWEAKLKALKSPQSITGRTGAILSLVFSPDGRYLAYGGSDKTVRVWDVESGTGTITFRGHTSLVEGVQFSPDGQRLVSCSPSQKEVKVWDLTRHPEFATLARTARDVESIEFHEDGQSLVSLTVDGRLQIWDAASGLLRAEHALGARAVLVEPAGVLADIAPGGRRLAARCLEDGRLVRIWDADSGKPVAACRGHTLPVFCLHFSADGRFLASCACDKKQPDEPHEIKVWDAANGELLATLHGRGQLFTLAFSPDARWLAVGGDKGVKVLDWSAGRTLVRLPAKRSSVTAVAFGPDGRRFACAGVEENKVHLWDCGRWGQAPAEPKPLHAMSAPGLLCDLAFSPDGKRLAGASRDLIRMWDAQTGVEVLTLRGAPQRYRDPPFNARIVFHRDGTRLAGTNWNESISVWDAPLQTDDESRLRQQQARRRAADERALFWHLQEAEYCAEHKMWGAAKFHLQRLGDAALPRPLQERKNSVVAIVDNPPK